MRRLVVPGEQEPGAILDLDKDKARYLLKVLRMDRGERFQAMDEKGRVFGCSILEETKDGLRIELGEPVLHVSDQARAPRIALVQALPKAQKMDLIVRQAAEAGVCAIFPVSSRNCVAREPTATDRQEKLERRRRIVREALQQSGSGVLTKVLPTTEPARLMELLASEGFTREDTLLLLCHEAPLAGMSLHEYCAGDPESIVVMVGPEGGFDPSEIESFLEAGFRPIHFGDSVLRTETAALYALAAVKTIVAERESWTISK